MELIFSKKIKKLGINEVISIQLSYIQSAYEKIQKPVCPSVLFSFDDRIDVYDVSPYLKDNGQKDKMLKIIQKIAKESKPAFISLVSESNVFKKDTSNNQVTQQECVLLVVEQPGKAVVYTIPILRTGGEMCLEEDSPPITLRTDDPKLKIMEGSLLGNFFPRPV